MQSCASKPRRSGSENDQRQMADKARQNDARPGVQQVFCRVADMEQWQSLQLAVASPQDAIRRLSQEDCMNDLIAKIRSAQIRAGESAVIDHLRQMEAGLLRRATNQAEEPSPETAPVRQENELKPCRWVQEDEGGYWQTSCGRYHEIPARSPAENGMKFCTYCGSALIGDGWTEE